jgi:phage-related minor tail protein
MIDDDSREGAAQLDRVAQDLRAVDGAARDLSRAIGGGLRQAFDSALRGGAQFGDVLRGLAADLARSGLRQALTPVTTALGQGAGHALSGAMQGLAAQVASGLGRSVRAFAKGGVVNGTTGFVSREGPGVMGEAGPEAILPLARGADGRLGVRGGGGMQVTFNVTTPDADSFVRSRPQVAAALARAVARGARRL